MKFFRIGIEDGMNALKDEIEEDIVAAFDSLSMTGNNWERHMESLKAQGMAGLIDVERDDLEKLSKLAVFKDLDPVLRKAVYNRLDMIKAGTMIPVAIVEDRGKGKGKGKGKAVDRSGRGGGKLAPSGEN
jgi:hypothetical protein